MIGGIIDAMKKNLLERAGMVMGILQPEPMKEARIDEDGQLHTARAESFGDVTTLDAVYRALFVIETGCSQLSLDVWSGSEQIEPPAYIRRPDIDSTQRAFIAQTVKSLALKGNAYWLKQFSRAGQFIGVKVANPTLMTVDASSEKPVYVYNGKKMRGSRVVHLKLTHDPGKVLGLSPIQACMTTLQGALKLRNYADNWTQQTGRPTGYLTTEKPLTQEQVKTFKKAANESFTQENGIAVLADGLKLEPLLLTPEELQFLQAQDANVVSIARMFGIPARLMLATLPGGSQTYANLEQDELTFIRYTLMAYLSEIESAFDEIAEAGLTVRFNLNALLRTDTKTRYEAHKIGIDAGFLYPDEVREIEGLPEKEKTDED